MSIRSYKDLEVYREAYELALEVYQCSAKFPRAEQYELTSQLKRAALSIPLNIAEGYGRKRSTADFKRFLGMAAGSCNEVQVLLDFALDLGFLAADKHQALAKRYTSAGERINALIDKWQ